MKKILRGILGAGLVTMSLLVQAAVAPASKSLATTQATPTNSKAAIVGYEPYLGNWINKTPGSLLKKVSISEEGDTIVIEAWGHCAKTSGICDWGKILINSQYPHGYEPWDASTQNAALTVRPVGQNHIQVVINGFFPEYSDPEHHPVISVLQRTPVSAT